MRKRDGHFKDRTGETRIAGCGLKMTIIAYRGVDDVDIQFEDGVIVEHKNYTSFNKGQISHPTRKTIRKHIDDHIGETAISSSGLSMKIIAFRDRKDIDVEFENGMIREHCTYHNFKKGSISPEKYLRGQQNVGKTNKNKNGMMMTIIKYRNKSDLDVQFEDGKIAEHRTMAAFRKGYLSYPVETPSKIGERRLATCGIWMEIIAYHAYDNVDIRFDDGMEVFHKDYNSFLNGNIGYPDLYKKRIGEVSMSREGKKMTLIAYRNSSDVDVQFEDGTILYNRQYANFKNGFIVLPVNHVGEKVECEGGLTAEIIAYRRCTDIDVKYSNGIIETKRTYYDFKHGIHPKRQRRSDLTGMITKTSSGIRVKVIGYRRSHDVDIQFEDGSIIEHTNTLGFIGKSLMLPMQDNLFHGVSVKKTFQDENDTYYICTFPDGSKDICTPQEIMARQGIKPVF